MDDDMQFGSCMSGDLIYPMDRRIKIEAHKLQLVPLGVVNWKLLDCRKLFSVYVHVDMFSCITS
jgi:hypothetical protein